MTTVGDLVRRSFREENLLPLGKSPTDAELAEGVSVFNTLWGALLGNQIGENLNDWQVPPQNTAPIQARWPLYPANQKLPGDVWPYPPQNARLLCAITVPTTVYLRQTPSDGARMSLMNIGTDFVTNPLTLSANGRLIEGSPQVVINTAITTPRRWFYRADLGSWQRLEPLTAESESPLPAEFDDFFSCSVAVRMAPRYSREPSPVTIGTAANGLSSAVGRYAQVMPTAADPDALMQMPYQSFNLPGWGWPMGSG